MDDSGIVVKKNVGQKWLASAASLVSNIADSVYMLAKIPMRC